MPVLCVPGFCHFLFIAVMNLRVRSFGTQDVLCSVLATVSKNQVLKTRVAISFDHQQRSSITSLNVAVHRFQLITVVEGKSCCATANKENLTVCMYTLLLFWLGKLATSPATEPASAGYPFQMPFAKRLKHSCNYDLQWPWKDSICFVIFGDWRYPKQKTSNITFFGTQWFTFMLKKRWFTLKNGLSRANQSRSITHQFCTPWRFLNYWVLSGWLSRTDLLIQLVFWPKPPVLQRKFDSNYPLVNKHSYWKWSFIVDLPIRNGDFPYLC